MATQAVESKPATKHGFQPGQSGNPAGRRVGSKNKVTREARELFSPLVQQAIAIMKAHLKTDKAGPDCATCRHYVDVIFGYVFGKPTQRQEIRIEDVRESARRIARELDIDEELAIREAEGRTP